jgi:hypothetical protein
MEALGAGKKAWLGALGLALAGVFAGAQIATWPVKLRYPGEEDLAEGPRLAEMVHLRQGVHIYDPPSLAGFDAAIHGPLYLLLGSRLVDPQEPAFLLPRLASMLGTLGCAVGGAVLAFWLSRSYFAAVLAPLLFLSYRIVTFHGLSARSDAVGLFLSFWGFLIAYRLQNSRRLLWAVPLILLGFYYKQQFVAVPLSVLLTLLLEKRYRLAAEFFGLSALGGLGLLGFFQFVVFHGQAFVTHFLLYNAIPLSGTRFGSGLIFWGALFFFPLMVGLEFLRLHRDRLLACFLACTLTLSIAGFAREGSDTNYFLESALVLSALFAALLAERISTPARAAELLVLLAISLLLGQLFALSPPRRADFERDRALQAFLRHGFSSGTLAFGYYSGDLLRARLAPPISDQYEYSWLIRKGMVPDRYLLTQLRERRFAIVVLNFDLQHEKDAYWTNYYLTDGLRQAILANYQAAVSLEMPEVEKFRPEDRFYVWVPLSGVPGLQARKEPCQLRHGSDAVANATKLHVGTGASEVPKRSHQLSA